MSTENQNCDWPKVAIIILNWNGWRDTLECLESVERLTYPNYEVILLDNGSVDGSVKQIEEWVLERPDRWGTPGDLLEGNEAPLPRGARAILRTGRLTVIRSEENLGFAGGCNAATWWALADPSVSYVYFLNNDARVSPNAISEVVFVARTVGSDLVGSAIWEGPGTGPTFAGSESVAELLWPTPVRIAFRLEAKTGATAIRVSMVPGSGMLLSRRLVHERIAATGHLFDPLLYLYGEELDLCMWALRRGYLATVALKSIVYHRSKIVNAEKMARIQYYLARNLLLVTGTHISAPYKYGFYCWHILFRLLLAFRWCITGKPQVAISVIRGLNDGIMTLARRGSGYRLR